MKEFDFTQIKHYKLYNFIKAVFRPLVKLVFKAKFKGLENVPQDKGTKYIVAINHTSAIDPIIVACPKELPPLHFMAKVELFKNPFGAWFLTHMYAFPVKRGKGDTSAIEYGEKILNEGHVMAICPEGKRIKDKGGVPQKAKAGVAIKQVTVSYGKLIKNSELGLDGENVAPSDIKAAANMVMGRITELWEAERNAG